MHKCFRKIRIVKGGKSKSKYTYNQILLRKKTELELFLKRCLCPDVEKKVNKDIDKLEVCLSESISKERYLKVKEHTKSMELGGRFSQLHLWKLKQRLYPRPKDPPMAKRDNLGNLITTPGPLKDLYMKTYIHRLRSREIETNLVDVYFLKTELWISRLKELRRIKTSEWTFNELRTAIKSLKSNKATDPNNMISELFKPSCMGEDLEKALLLLFNGMKSNMVIPDFIQHQNITSIYKKKGSRLEMKNERGIFILTTLKKILDKLIYQEKQDDIDRHMSDSNIGSRKNKQVKDHLFIIHGIVNSVVNGKEDCIDIQIYDLEQAFDALWLEDCMLDLYDSLSEKNRDDKVALLYKSSEKNLVSINTPHGLTERGDIPTIVQQGGTWGPLLCSNSIDSIGRDLRINNNSCYLYKNSVRILPLGMVDDITAISKCGVDSLDLNTYINSKIELKKLRFHVPDKTGRTKCHKIHVGSSSSHTCPILKVHESEMKEVDEDEYLGDIVSRDGKNKQNIHKRISRGLGVISEILNIVNQITFGNYYYETALLLREALFLSSVLNNTEVMYNMTTAEMEEFDKLDRLLLKRLLHAPISTPTEAFYLELGLIPASIHIKARRVKYLHYLLNKSRTEMLSMFFWTQWNNPCKGDWVNTVKQDLIELEIPVDVEFLKSYSKQTFKKYVNEKATKLTFKSMMFRKESHSKMRNLNYLSLEIQEYFTRGHLSKWDAHRIFLYRTRMIFFWGNFRTGSSRLCPLCLEHPDTQELFTECSVMRNEYGEFKYLAKSIFSNSYKTEEVKNFVKILTFRENLIKGKD